MLIQCPGKQIQNIKKKKKKKKYKKKKKKKKIKIINKYHNKIC